MQPHTDLEAHDVADGPLRVQEAGQTRLADEQHNQIRRLYKSPEWLGPHRQFGPWVGAADGRAGEYGCVSGARSPAR